MRCENCGQTVLTSDTVCWHCGRALSPPDSPPKTNQPAAKKQPTIDISLSAIAIFGIMTALIILLLFLVIGALGNKPFVVINPDRNPGWVPVTDQSLRFTYDLPPDWVWAEKNQTNPSALFETATSGDFDYSAVFTALPAHTPDSEWRMIAVSPTLNEPAQRFLLVATSATLHTLSVNDVLALTAAETTRTEVLETAVTDNLLATPQAHLLLQVTTPNTTWKCQQEVVNGTAETYLLAACATQAEYPRYISELNNILRSFQPLSH